MPKKPSALTMLAKERNIDSQTFRQALKKGVQIEELSLWVEGSHYVRCPECSKGYGELTLHLKKTHGWDEDRFDLYSGSLMAPLFKKSRAKTEDQKQQQSETLKARFQTPEGEVTRQQIREAAKRHMDNGYRDVASAFLRNLNQSESMKKKSSERFRNLWAQGSHRAKLQKWRDLNSTFVRDSAAHARHFLNTTSKLHSRVKEVLNKLSPLPFQSEYPLGVFMIDECLPDQKIVLEVMGCYWHSCVQCGLKGPRKNLSRDVYKRNYLEKEGYNCLYIWEHDCRDSDSIKETLNRLLEGI